jgi:8-oxo-dGTP pyrophosphatase MutT (NUDIX family)
MSIVEEELIYDGKKHLLRWHADLPIPTSNITQVRGYIFDTEGKVLIVESRGEHWTTVGGHPEGNETPVETFKREVMEEACVEIENETFLGFIEVIPENGDTHYFQLRYAALLKKKLPFEARFETTACKFVLPDEISKYIPWTGKSPVFAEEMKAALAVYKKIKK